MTTAKKEQITDMFQAYIMGTIDPGDFYHMTADEWAEILPEIEESYIDIDQPFPFTADDLELIRTMVDNLLEQEFGEDVMATYQK